MRRSTGLLFMLCIVHLGYTQGTSATPRDNFKATILRMQQEYRNLEKLHLVMAIEVFEGASATNPFFSETADIMRDKHKNCACGAYGHPFGQEHPSREDTNPMFSIPSVSTVLNGFEHSYTSVVIEKSC
ncbi:MAG TPA: hypothetical protein VK658_23285 [Chryseolinea sp.]|nr:hypothetical protein [Chryseolinea sp.]